MHSGLKPSLWRWLILSESPCCKSGCPWIMDVFNHQHTIQRYSMCSREVQTPNNSTMFTQTHRYTVKKWLWRKILQRVGGQPVNQRVNHGRRVYNQGCDHFIFITTKSFIKRETSLRWKRNFDKEPLAPLCENQHSVMSSEICTLKLVNWNRTDDNPEAKKECREVQQQQRVGSMIWMKQPERAELNSGRRKWQRSSTTSDIQLRHLTCSQKYQFTHTAKTHVFLSHLKKRWWEQS